MFSIMIRINVWLLNDVLMGIVHRQPVTYSSETGVADH